MVSLPVEVLSRSGVESPHSLIVGAAIRIRTWAPLVGPCTRIARDARTVSKPPPMNLISERSIPMPGTHRARRTSRIHSRTAGGSNPSEREQGHHRPLAHASGLPGPTPTRWAWLQDTYWYVPQANVSAILFDASSGSLLPVSDQTVYHISGYRNGYFWGETVAQLGSGSPSSSSLVGSVTPQGRVLLHFTSGSNVTEGYGEMTRKGRQWTMENQMFTGSSSGQIGHWAYMVQTRPGMRSWNSLPSVGVSVPQFLVERLLRRRWASRFQSSMDFVSNALLTSSADPGLLLIVTCFGFGRAEIEIRYDGPSQPAPSDFGRNPTGHRDRRIRGWNRVPSTASNPQHAVREVPDPRTRRPEARG